MSLYQSYCPLSFASREAFVPADGICTCLLGCQMSGITTRCLQKQQGLEEVFSLSFKGYMNSQFGNPLKLWSLLDHWKIVITFFFLIDYFHLLSIKNVITLSYQKDILAIFFELHHNKINGAEKSQKWPAGLGK